MDRVDPKCRVSRPLEKPSVRLQKVLEVGDTLALFPVLKDWTTEELLALLKDVEWLAEVSLAAIDQAWKKTALEPNLFFNAANSKALDEARREAELDVVAMTSEIASVAIYYLNERGVNVETEGEWSN